MDNIAERTYFHVFKDMIDNGDMAKMRPQAFAVYCVIKAHTNFTTGRSLPRIELIAEKTGISKGQVMRSLTKLESFGYIAREKTGRNNIYLFPKRSKQHPIPIR